MQFKNDFSPAYRKWVAKQPTRPQRAVAAPRETRRRSYLEEGHLLYAVLMVLLLEAVVIAGVLIALISGC